MAVAFFSRSAFFVLNGFNRTPMQAREAVFAMVKPKRPAAPHFYISYRAYLHAQTARGAFFVCPEPPGFFPYLAGPFTWRKPKMPGIFIEQNFH
jgi:hypothetical protein